MQDTYWVVQCHTGWFPGSMHYCSGIMVFDHTGYEDNCVFVFHEVGFQLLAFSQYWNDEKKKNICIFFLKKFSTTGFKCRIFTLTLALLSWSFRCCSCCAFCCRSESRHSCNWNTWPCSSCSFFFRSRYLESKKLNSYYYEYEYNNLGNIYYYLGKPINFHFSMEHH